MKSAKGKWMEIGKKNVGAADRVARVVLGAVALYLFGINYFDAPLSFLVLLAGVALLATGLWGSCTLYTVLGISTGRKKR